MEGMSTEDLLEAIQSMKGLSDEDREEIINSLSQQNKPGVPAPLPVPPFTHQAMVLAVMLTLLGLIFEMHDLDGVGGEGRLIGGEKFLIRNSYVAELLMMCLTTSFERVKMSEADVMRDMLQGMGAFGKGVGMNEEDSQKAGSILEQLINGYKELDDEEKKEFVENVQKTFQGKVQEAFTSHMTNAFYMKAGLLLTCVLIILAIFVFFGYKLIKSIQDKEKKKEEKKKQKQSKKRK